MCMYLSLYHIPFYILYHTSTHITMTRFSKTVHSKTATNPLACDRTHGRKQLLLRQNSDLTMMQLTFILNKQLRGWSWAITHSSQIKAGRHDNKPSLCMLLIKFFLTQQKLCYIMYCDEIRIVKKSINLNPIYNLIQSKKDQTFTRICLSFISLHRFSRDDVQLTDRCVIEINVTQPDIISNVGLVS